MIELASEQAQAAGIMHLCEDEAGPYQAIPQPGAAWHPQGKSPTQPHAYVRAGTAKLLTLFRPPTGQVRATGVFSAPKAVLHPWLQQELGALLDELDQEPLPVRVPLPQDHPLQRTWEHWSWSYEPPKPARPLRLIVIWDTLAGHLSYAMVRWLLQRGILPLYTPLSGSWLTRGESLQRILVRRALAGQHPQTAQHLIDWFEQAPDAFRLEWQASAATGTGPTEAIGAACGSIKAWNARRLSRCSTCRRLRSNATSSNDVGR